MNPSLADKKDFLVKIAYYGVVAGLIYIAFEYGTPLFLPFLFGYLFALLSHRITRNQSSLMLAVIYVVLGVVLILISSGIIGVIGKIVANIPDWYRNDIEPAMDQLYVILQNMNDSYNIPGLSSILDTALDVAKNGLSSLASNAISVITSGVVKVPNILFSVMIFIISSFYFTADYKSVNAFVKKHGYLKQWASNKLFTLVRCYAILIAMTFVELSIGYSILRIEDAVLLALATAMVDILPILGTGTILIPWGIVSMVLGNWYRGIGLLVLYVIITMVRQYVEPKLVGGNLGIPPILSLMSMVIGLRLFGIVGMIGLPLLLSYYLYAMERKKEDEAKRQAEIEALPEDKPETSEVPLP